MFPPGLAGRLSIHYKLCIDTQRCSRSLFFKCALTAPGHLPSPTRTPAGPPPVLWLCCASLRVITVETDPKLACFRLDEGGLRSTPCDSAPRQGCPTCAKRRPNYTTTGNRSQCAEMARPELLDTHLRTDG